MTSRRWPFVSSDCRIDPATITHKESIHWIHTTEGCDEGGDAIGRQLGRKRQPLNSLTRERFSPSIDTRYQVNILDKSRSLLFERATLRHLIRRFHRYRRSTRFRESAGSCPQIFSVIDPQLASNCVKCVREMRRRIKLCTDLSAGRHATAAFPS